MKRSPFDGFPYYCKICGFGWNEYMACEAGDCELESGPTALSRKKTGAIGLPTKRAIELMPGDAVYMHDDSVRVVKEVSPGHGHIPKGTEGLERCCLIVWEEGEFSMLLRSQEVILTSK